MTYQVKLEVFEGPFDLLLHLISRRKVEITDIDLSEITADFVASLQGIDELDLETATRFLVVAATLIELKAARLLPSDEAQELEDLLGDARDLLYARLLEYRAFRDVALLLGSVLEEGAAHLGRAAALEPHFQRLVPDLDLPVDAAGLAALAAATLAPKPPARVDLTHIRRSYISLRDAARSVLSRLPADGLVAPFRGLVRDRSRGDRVVFFLALLELYKLGHVDLEQEEHRAPLSVRRREGGRDLGALTDDYTVDPEDDDHDEDEDEDDHTEVAAEVVVAAGSVR